MKQTEIDGVADTLIPDDWEVKSLGEVATIVGGGTPSTLNSAYWNGDIQWFTPAELSDSKKYVSKSERTITERGLKESSAKLLPKGTVLLTTRASIGITAILENPASTNQGFQSLIAKNNCCSEFLYYVIPLIKDEMLSRASGSTFAEISAKKLSTITFQLPPLPEQQRIAKVLSDVDSLISTTEKLIQKKKNIKQGTMQNLLTGKKRLPGFAKSTNYKQSELGLIPEDWEVKSLGELFDMKAGGDVDKEHFSYCKSSLYKYKIFSNGLENEGIYGYTDLPKYKGNAITITGRGTVGIAMFREEDFDAVIRLLVLNSKNDNLTNNSYITEEINSCISFPNESTGVPQLTVPQIRDIVIALPSKEEQTAIANVLSSMDKEIETLNTKLEKYRNLKTAMMQQLLTGKIRL